ncbi:XRE family transcriptional regulator [Leptospira levettii]|uniref:helix-turn-helix domain-containing protein n=1 Tax=Leptospira levettii TaxID=2023178 RepID=UPI0010920A12|nr:helix-turn-helix transcriptional regulator [Leptospira levettii]TGM78615.1 XRE family transcriptional regulator [Leptospira levettii]
MEISKKAKLEKLGWKIGTTSEFLNLTPSEDQYIELKLALSKSVQKKRLEMKITQVKLADILKSSQSRIAKIESGDKSVSIDLIINSYFALGATIQDIAKILYELPKDQKDSKHKDKKNPSKLLPV